MNCSLKTVCIRQVKVSLYIDNYPVIVRIDKLNVNLLNSLFIDITDKGIFFGNIYRPAKQIKMI